MRAPLFVLCFILLEIIRINIKKRNDMLRVKQFINYAVSYFKKIDNDFLSDYLNEKEFEYFNALLKTEKQHSIRVAKKCLNVYKEFDIEENELESAVKMCLMHDVGKKYSSLNLFFKPFIVIISTKKHLRKIMFFLNEDRVIKYFNHAKYSFEMLKDLGYPCDVLNSIRYHHSTKNITDNKYIRLLKYCDSMT